MPSIIIDPAAVPGLTEAQAKERAYHAIPLFSDTVPVCGFWVRLLTPRLSAELGFAGSPFVCGGRPTLQAAAHFIWRLHPDYVPRGCGLRHVLRLITMMRIRRRVARLGLAAVSKEIDEYTDFILSSRVRSSGSSDSASDGRELVHSAVENADYYAAEMGIGFAEYMDTPIPILHQRYRALLIRNNRAAAIWDESEQMLHQHATEILNP